MYVWEGGRCVWRGQGTTTHTLRRPDMYDCATAGTRHSHGGGGARGGARNQTGDGAGGSNGSVQPSPGAAQRGGAYKGGAMQLARAGAAGHLAVAALIFSHERGRPSPRGLRLHGSGINTSQARRRAVR